MLKRTLIKTLNLWIVLALMLFPKLDFAADDAGTVAIDEVLKQIKMALVDVQTTLAGNALPPLKQVKISLQVVAAKKGGPKLKLWIVTFGHTWEKDRSQQIDIVLIPPKAVRSIVPATLSDELADAIVSAARGMREAGQGPVPLKFTSLDVDISFTVKQDTTIGVNVPVVLVPITAELSGDFTKTAVHKIVVSFAEPPTAK